MTPAARGNLARKKEKKTNKRPAGALGDHGSAGGLLSRPGRGMGSLAEADLGVGSGFERVLYAGTFRRTVVTDQVSGSAPFGFSLFQPTSPPRSTRRSTSGAREVIGSTLVFGRRVWKRLRGRLHSKTLSPLSQHTPLLALDLEGGRGDLQVSCESHARQDRTPVRL